MLVVGWHPCWSSGGIRLGHDALYLFITGVESAARAARATTKYATDVNECSLILMLIWLDRSCFAFFKSFIGCG